MTPTFGAGASSLPPAGASSPRSGPSENSTPTFGAGASSVPEAPPAYQHNGRTVSAETFYAVACDPRRHVAVEACAGAGKTWMLVSRILRALLDGAQPHEILAITFTKRAASEMSERLYQWLAEFSTADAEELDRQLVMRGVIGKNGLPPTQNQRDALSNLYQTVLATGRQVQIRTFHGWFAALLRGAPLAVLQQLGLPASYQLLEDDRRAKALVWRRFYAGLVASPGRGLTLRASWADTFRAPGLVQLFSPQSEGYYNSVPDPRRPVALTGDLYDGPNVSRLVRTGGNPALRPELGRVIQAGATWAPTAGALAGLALEATWFRYDINDLIAGVSPAYVLDNELGGLGDLVHRDAGAETYTNTTTAPITVLTGPAGATTLVAPGQSAAVPGRLQRIDSYTVNLSRRRLIGADFGVRYARELAPLGRWTLDASATYTQENSYAYDLNQPLVDGTGRNGSPSWRGRFTADWERGIWQAGATLLYTPSSGGFATDGAYTKPYRVLHLSGGWRAPRDSWLRGTRVQLGVDDVLNAEPPLHNDPPIGYNYGSIARPQGRFWRVSLKREW